MTTTTKVRPNWRTPDAVRTDVDETTDRLGWLKERRNGIGGTDAAALLGVHVSLEIASATDVTPATVFLDKTATDEPVEDDKAIFALGHHMEPTLLLRASERFGITTKAGGFFRNKKEPWMYANPDALASDGGNIECKTASNRSKAAEKWLAGDVSPHAYVQSQHYLAVTGRSHTYYTVGIRNDYSGWESVPRHLWGESWFVDMAIKEFVQVGPIDRDEAMIAHLLDVERTFWAAVQSGVMPDNIAADLAPAQRFRVTAPDREAAPAIPAMTFDDLLRLRHIKRSQKALADERAAIESRIKGEMGDAEFLAIDGHRYARWHTINQTTFDKSGLARDYPDLIEKYTRRGTARRFDLIEDNA